MFSNCAQSAKSLKTPCQFAYTTQSVNSVGELSRWTQFFFFLYIWKDWSGGLSKKTGMVDKTRKPICQITAKPCQLICSRKSIFCCCWSQPGFYHDTPQTDWHGQTLHDYAWHMTLHTLEIASARTKISKFPSNYASTPYKLLVTLRVSSELATLLAQSQSNQRKNLRHPGVEHYLCRHPV